MQLQTITDTNIQWLSHSRFIANPSKVNEWLISSLEDFWLSVSEVLEWWFATPTQYTIWPHMWWWYKDYTSGRSFQASFQEEDWMTTTIINKWNDIFEWDKYRRYHKEDAAYVWQEFLWLLMSEYETSNQIQTEAMRQLGRPTYTTVPLSLSQVQKTLSEKGEIIDYMDYMRRVMREFPEYQEGMMRTLMRMWLLEEKDIQELINFSSKKPTINTEKLIEFMEKIPMATYMYLIKGMNTRLVEHKRIGKRKLDFVLRREYPECISEDGELDTRKVLQEFCRRLWENLWITYSAGFSYKRQSVCVLIDTTLWGISMDNWHVGEWIGKENVVNRLNELYSIVEFFNKEVLWWHRELEQEAFRDILVPEMLKYTWERTEEIEWYIKDLTISGANLSKSFYMVNDFWKVRKTLKRLSIFWVWPMTIHTPLVKRNYFING